MSKILKELLEATGEKPQKDGESRQAFLKRVAAATADLKEKEWDELSEAAQDWYNANADARNKAKKAGKDLPDFEDFADAIKDEDDAPRGRRRAGDEDDEKPTKGKDDKPSVDKLEEGQRVKITTKRRDIEGEVVENNAKKAYVVIKEEGGKEREVDYDEVQSLEVFHGDAGKDDEGGGSAEPEVGDEVELTNSRGKTFTGTITEMDDEDITIETADGPEDFRRARVETIKVLKKGKAGGGKGKASKEEEPEKPPRGGKEEKGGKGKAGDEGAEKTRTRSTDGVPIGTKIKQAIADNPQADEKEIAAILKKAGVEVKENTLGLNYTECHKLLKELHARDLLNIKKFKPMV